MQRRGGGLGARRGGVGEAWGRRGGGRVTGSVGTAWPSRCTGVTAWGSVEGDVTALAV